MIVRKAFHFRLMPKGEHIRKMNQFCGCARFVFNRALAWQNEQYAADNAFSFRYSKATSLLPAWKKELEWLKACHSQVLQQALKDLERGFKNFFAKRADFPRFKRKGSRDSFRFPQGVKLEQQNNRIYLPKIGWVRYRNSQEVVGEIKNVTVSKRCDHWYVAIQTEFEPSPLPHPSPNEAIGRDMGISRFATFSDGSFVSPENSFKRHESALRKAQQSLSRKVRFSRNWQKARVRVQRIHARIACLRQNFLHQLTSRLSKNHALVVIEDLKIRNMSKSAKGTKENPGKRVRAKSGLNKAILDQGWGEFRRQLEYKLAWLGGRLLSVPPQYTSQTCPSCQHVSKENRPSQAVFACIACGYSGHADHIAAINILRAGHVQLACEVSGAVMPPAAGTHRREQAA